MKKKPLSVKIIFQLMKIALYQTVLAVVFAVATMANDTHAQELLDKKITLKVENQQIKTILSQLEKQAEIKFMYTHQLIKATRKVTLVSSDERLEDVLRKLLIPLNISYEVNGNRILLTTIHNDKSEIKSDNQFNKFIAVEIKGKITDETGNPMPGVNIAIKGTVSGTTSDSDGNFSINAPENSTLIISFIGYTTQEINIGTQTSINVQLKTDIKTLDDVVIVGYGTQKRASVVAAITSISSKDINVLPVASVEQALQGRVPSVMVTNNGAPGETPLVRIRGINSINYAGNPFYVVDGIPQVGDFNNFNTKDIESLEVLKDASSAAIYGSRASTGVILITTKKGSRDGKIHVDIDSYAGVQSAWKQLKLLNTAQYLKYGTDLLNNANAQLPSRFSHMNDPIYPGATQTYAQTNTDWQKEMFKKALITQTNVSVSGGNEKSRFYASASYFKQDGIMLGTGYERGSFRINSEHSISKIFTFGQTLLVSYGLQKKEQSPGGRTQIQNLIRMTPYMPVYDPNLIGGYRGPNADDGTNPQNPVRAAIQDLDQLRNARLLGTVYLDANITKWLKYRFNVGLDYTNQREYIFNPSYDEGYNNRPITNISESRTDYFTPVYTNQLTIDKTFGKHSFNVLGAIEYQSSKSVNINGTGNQPSTHLNELPGLSAQTLSGQRIESAIYSYIGRLNYDFASKYLFSATFRHDGSSLWAPGKKFGDFPSLGIGWRISEEAFMKDISFISELKLRASTGKVGYTPPVNYPWQVVINSNTNATYGNTNSAQGSYFDKLGNQNLSWEITKMSNFGIDAGFFKNRLTFTAEYYNRQTDNLILDIYPATSAGYSQSTQGNAASMRSWGYEFLAGFSEAAKDFKWNVSANLGITKNVVNNLYSPKSVLDRGANVDITGGDDVTRTEAGQPVQSFYGYQTDGIFQSADEIAKGPLEIITSKPGDIRYKDLNGDGKITPDDRKYLGSFIPKFNYGFNLSASYKGFDAGMFFQGVQGNKIYNGVKSISQGMLRLFNASTDVLNAWTPTNTNTNIPRAVSGDAQNLHVSDRFIESGSYLRLKSISLGYTLSNSTLQAWTKGTLSKARVYVSAQNLLTFTKYTGYDPEIGARSGNPLTQGIDYGQFPQARTLMVGLQVGF